MVVELACLTCPCSFRTAPDTPHDEVVRLMTDDGPWFGLAPGGTFEDMIFTALARRGRILCPACGKSVAVHEASFGDDADALISANRADEDAWR
jgi:hypothetical protein